MISTVIGSTATVDLSEYRRRRGDFFPRCGIAVLGRVFQLFEAAAAVEVEKKSQVRLAREEKGRGGRIVVEMLVRHAVRPDRQGQKKLPPPAQDASGAPTWGP